MTEYKFIHPIFLITILLLAGGIASGQNTGEQETLPPIIPRERDIDTPKTMREAMAKRAIDQRRKEYETMLKRGDEAVEIVEKLSASIEHKSVLSAEDKKNLSNLEKLVKRIRSDLGGRDDGIDNLAAPDDDSADEKVPSDLKEAFVFLKNRTKELVDELKATSRFSISASAIKSTNSVIRLARFLRAK